MQDLDRLDATDANPRAATPRLGLPCRPIRFFHRGAVVSVDDVASTRSVLDWLREDAHCTGTKEGCNEGDCGACTVVIGELAAAHDPAAVRGLTLRAVNACIQFLPTLHAKALFTVEDLKAMDPGRLHPVQQAMVDCHGSQCGFCTPGFVMSLWSAYERHRAGASAASPLPSRQKMADELSGNLCRCTGYRPILDAGQRMFELPGVDLDTAPVVAALQGLQRGETFRYRTAGPTADPTLGPPAGPTAGPTFHAPTTLDELARLREQHPTAQLLAGATDVGLWVTKQFRPLGDILYLGDVAELKRVVEQPAPAFGDLDGDPGGDPARAAGDHELYIGAGASLEAAWSALAARVPTLTDVWLRFGSKPIRNAGTMGGNVANGSPIGDAPPVLMALDAQVELRRGTAVRRLPLSGFYLGYMKNRLMPGEFVQGIAVPLVACKRQVRAYKISKRFDSDISAVCAGFAIELDEAGLVTTTRLAFGGMAAVVERAAEAEAALLGRPWDEAAVAAAQQALAAAFTPLSDMRASAHYRLQVAQNLLQRFWFETRAENPLPAHATSVFSGMPHDTQDTHDKRTPNATSI